MNNNNIIEYVKNNGGITLDKNKTSSTLKSGYFVSLEGYEDTTKNIDNIIKFIDKKLEFIKDKKDFFVGVWYNEDNQKYYVDISKHFKNKKDALYFGKKNKQLSIYDIKNNSSIDLKYNIKFYTVYKIIRKNEKIKDYKIIIMSDKKQDVRGYVGKKDFLIKCDMMSIQDYCKGL